MLEAPARVIGPQDAAHHVVPDHIAQLLVEELRLGIDHHVVRGEVAVALADHRDRLAPALDVPEEDVALYARVRGALALGFEVPPRLEARESLIEPSLAPLIVGEDAHRIVVPDLVHDQADAGAAVHHHHGKLGAAGFDTMHLGDLRPGEFSKQLVEPAERHFSAAHGGTPAPGDAVARLVERAHDDVAVAAFFVDVGGIQGEREVVDGVGIKANAFSGRPYLPTPVRGPRCAVPVALVIDPQVPIGLGLLPAGITFDRHAGRAAHLVLREIERHVEARELAVEFLPPRARTRFPA